MNANDILTLVKAGFTKDEIMQLATAQAPEEDPEITQEPQEKVTAKQPAEEEAPKEPEAVKKLDDVISRLDQITSGMQSMAVKGSRMPERETAEEALAKIINPYLT